MSKSKQGLDHTFVEFVVRDTLCRSASRSLTRKEAEKLTLLLTSMGAEQVKSYQTAWGRMGPPPKAAKEAK